MGRREELYIVIGLLIAALSCAAGWLALPQLQPWLVAQIGNPLFLPLVLVGALALALLAALAFLLRDWIAATWRALFPNHRLENRYLHAVQERLRDTWGAVVISERDENYLPLDLLTAYSQLTLGPDSEDANDTTPASPPKQNRSNLAMADGEKGDQAPVRSIRRKVADALIWLPMQGALLGSTLIVLRGLLISPAGEFRLSWGGGILALLAILAWLALAALLQRVVLPRLTQMLDQRSACTAPSGTPGAEIWHHPRLLIMGDPGSGKTTLLRHIAVVCAQELLRLKGRRRLRDVYGWPTQPFPIYIPLRALREAAIKKNKPLLKSYAETLREVSLLGEVVLDLPLDFFQKRAEQGGCIILLDAFDELRDPNARKDVGERVAELPRGPENKPNRIVVTSRIVGYEGQLNRAGFTRRRLTELTDEQSRAFIRQRYRALAASGVRAAGERGGQRWDSERRAESLIRRLPDNPGLRRLSRNPFLLSLIVSVHLKSLREPPRQRHALYERTMAMLVEEWERLKDSELSLEPTAPEAELDADRKLRLLYELAWAMYERTLSSTDARSHTVITSAAAVEVLANALREIPSIAAGRSGEVLESFCRSEAKRWLRNLGQRGGVLQPLGNVAGTDEEQLQFAHQTFQEYLASQAIDTSAPEMRRQRVSRLRERWNDRRWREVVLLYSSTIPDATPIVTHLLAQGDQYADLLAGAVLAEQPNRLDSQVLEQVLRRLYFLVKAGDVPISAALEATDTIAETGLTHVDRMLAALVRNAPKPALRVRAIERLAGTSPYRPARDPLAPNIQNLMLHCLEQERHPLIRLAAGFALARHDPRYDDGWLPEMLHVPAGPFVMGSDAADKDAGKVEKPQHRLALADFWIAKTPVTNAQWRRFVDAGGYRTRRYWSKAGWRWLRCGWEPPGDYSTGQGIAILLLGPLFDPLVRLLLRRQPFSQPHPESWDDPDWNGDNQPVTGISFYEAEAYCAWLSEAARHPYELPTEAQWEKAARGEHGLRYPWGNTWEEGRCNSAETDVRKPTPVGSFPGGASPYGALDMAGNVWEWCATVWRSNYNWRKADAEDRLFNFIAWWIGGYTLRGGSYGLNQTYVRGAYRSSRLPRNRSNVRGLRVASRAPRSHPDS